MSEADSDHGSGRTICGAECSDGTKCQIPVESGTCHIPSHQPEADGEAAGADSPNGESGTMPTEQSWWETNGKHILDMLDWSSRDGESDSTTAARRAAKVRSEWGHEAFGTCSTNGCNRWSNGFEADHCGKPSHQPEADDSEEDSDDGESQNGFTRSEYEADLVAAGLSSTEAAEKAEERFRGS